MKKIDWDDQLYHEKVDRCLVAQFDCPYFEKRKIEIETGDDEWCLYDMAPCWHGRCHCPAGKW